MIKELMESDENVMNVVMFLIVFARTSAFGTPR